LLHPNERVVLQVFADKLGLTEERYQQLLTMAEQLVERGGKEAP
jgi:DnaJ-domain-containing protein 1